MWTLDSALYFIRYLYSHIPNNTWHLALGGGVLLRGESNHDLDIVVLPHNTTIEADFSALTTALEKVGFFCKEPVDVKHKKWAEKGITDRKYVSSWEDAAGKRIDIIMCISNENMGDPPSKLPSFLTPIIHW